MTKFEACRVSKSIYRIDHIHRARWNGRLVKIFTAYIQQPDGTFVHFGQFTAPPRTANRDLWKIAAEAPPPRANIDE